MLSGGFRFTQPTLPRAMTTTKKEGSGTPTDVFSQPPRPHLHPPPLTGEDTGGGAARVHRRQVYASLRTQNPLHALAYRRSTAVLAAASERRSSAPGTRFLGRGRGARSESSEQPGSKDRALFSGRYPLLPVPVQRAPRRPVIMPAGRSFPKPPGSGVYRSARRHRTRSTFRRAIICLLTEARNPCNI